MKGLVFTLLMKQNQFWESLISINNKFLRWVFLVYFFSLAVDRAQELFSKLDADNDGDITEAEFLRACLEDESLTSSLVTSLAFSGLERKEEDKEGKERIPRFSLAAENRVTTKRRFSDICTKKNLLYNS